VTVAVDQLGEAIDARPLMHTVRARLDALVADLDDADWRRATVCPGWDVADLVAHIVGADLGRLSRTHDRAVGSAQRPNKDPPTSPPRPPRPAPTRTCPRTSTASTRSGWSRSAG
jgi:uncharacterized protein (TIGR03083 family)